jgi:DnaJ-class molecular chaperone
MADNKTETLRALCAQAQTLGLTSTEFWRRVKLNPTSEEDMEEAAFSTLSEMKAGGVPCSKCDGTGVFTFDSGPNAGTTGMCYRCKGKGYEDVADIKRNFGHRTHNPTTHVVRQMPRN